MYATLKDSQLVTQGRDGEQFVVDVDGPDTYEVRTCRERNGVVEFGTGTVTVEQSHLAHIIAPYYRLEIVDVTFD